MDALFSLPLLSVLLIPSHVSTSFNVLFFYMTWSILLLSHSALKVEFLGTLFIRVIFYLLPSYVFFLFDAAIPSLAANIKEHGNIAIATSQKQGGRRNLWWKIPLISTFNVILGVAVQTAIEYLLTKVLHVRSALKITTTLPLPWAIGKDIVRGFLLREILTYLLHRYTLHGPSPLRAMHANWYHKVPASYSLVAHYDHPIAYIMRVFLPTYLPAAFFRFHLLTFHAFLALVSLEELFTYSGYNILPSGFILGGIARRQERHLMGGGKGNFSAYGLVDLLAGTNLGNNVLEDIEEEAEGRDVGEKSKRVGRRAKAKGSRVTRQLRERSNE